MKHRKVTGAAAALCLSLTTSVLLAANMPIKGELQGSFFKRIFSYDSLLGGSEKIVVLVIADDKKDKDAMKLAEAFRKAGLFPAVVAISDVSEDLTATLQPSTCVAYIMPGVDHARVTELCAKKGILSVSGVPSLAEQGHVSVSLDNNNDRPQIVVNLPRLQAEGHELSAELLKLSKLIR